MFKIVANPTFTHAVPVHVPSNDGHTVETLKVTYRVLRTSQFQNYDISTAVGLMEFCKAVVVKLDDLQGDAGEPLVFSDAVFAQVLDIPYARLAILNGYLEGIGKARLGN